MLGGEFCKLLLHSFKFIIMFKFPVKYIEWKTEGSSEA